MKTIIWTCALAVGLSVALSNPAFALLDHDGSPWTHVLNYDQAPDSAATFDGDGTQFDGWLYNPAEPGFGVQNAADVWTFNGGIGEMRGIGSGSAWSWYGLPSAFGGNANAFPGGAQEGFTIEWRVKVNVTGNDAQQRIGVNLNTLSGTGGDPYGIQVHFSDQPGNETNQIINTLATKGKVATPEAYATPVTDGNFHTYRLTLDPMDLSGGQPPTVNGNLYVDGNPTPLAADWGIATAAGDATGRADVGYISGSPGPFSADWDFFRAHVGATPAPEPATLALVAIGALGLIQRRRH